MCSSARRRLNLLDRDVRGARDARAAVGARVARVDRHRLALAHGLRQLDGAERALGPREEGLDHLAELVAPEHALLGRDGAAAEEDHEGRHRLDAQRGRDALGAIDVDLDHLGLALELVREGLDLGLDRLARARTSRRRSR